mgnify:CR=1 FL=1
MSTPSTIVFTDLVDSTRLGEQLGDAAMAHLWSQHDELARALFARHAGREVGRSDGFLALFDTAATALLFALAYHRGLEGQAGSPRARVGMHTGAVALRTNRPDDVARGATPFEVDGIALPLAARVMSMAQGGQTLLSAATVQALQREGCGSDLRLQSHGFWRLKGVSDPVEIFEAGHPGASLLPPPDSPKAYRVTLRRGGWVTVQELPHNLPAERDAFVGREPVLEALASAFAKGARLLTLLGLGGVGKTRLALKHAHGWLGDYAGGALFCDLSAARTADGVVHAVAQALGLSPGRSDPVAQVAESLAARGECLVILDNFEQVARHAEATLGCWLERAAQARFLVTSREVLGIVGEHTLAVPPLGLEEAVRVFELRALAAGAPELSSLESAERQALPELMEVLDRLPLAIELAAARARWMGPRAMLLHMGERFRFLAARGGRHDRQSTMRATLDWSWELLAAPEREVLATLAVFEGGFDLAAAQAVVDAVALRGAWLGDTLQSLVEKSLLRPAQEGRLGMLRTVHDYAARRLDDTGAAAGAEARHWRYFAAIDESAALRGRGAELDNLVIACRRAVAAEPAQAARLLGRCWAVLRLTGPFRLAIELGEAVAAALPGPAAEAPTVDRVIGSARLLLGEPAVARGHFERAISRAASVGDWPAWGETMGLLAGLELSTGRVGAARLLLDEVRAHTAADADTTVRYTRLNAEGRLHFMQSEWPAAWQSYSDAREVARAAGHARWLAGLEGNLGMVARAQGRRDDARRCWELALSGAEAAGDRSWAGNTHCNLGLLLHELGDGEGARHHLTEAVAIAQVMGNRRLEATARCNLGMVADALADLAAAVEQQTQAAALAQAAGDPRLEGQARGYLALACSQCGRHDEAAREMQAALGLLEAQTDGGLLTLALLQATVVAWSAGDESLARARWGSANDGLGRLSGPGDPEVQAMRLRAGRWLGP